MSSEAAFIKYKGEKIFVIPLAGGSTGHLLYYPKGDAMFVMRDNTVELKEIVEIIGEGAGYKLADPVDPWEDIKRREVRWHVLDKEIVSDNILAVIEKEKDYQLLYEAAFPERMKSFVFRDKDPHEYSDWCCVLLVVKKDVENYPDSFKKVYVKDGKILV